MQILKKKEDTGYPSVDRTHLRNTNFFERNPIIPPLSFSDVMDFMFFVQGEHNIVDCLDLEVNTKEFQKDSLLIAKAFLELGVKPKDIVVVSMPNYYQAIPIFKATNMIGAITTYLNPLATIKETKEYLNMYDSPVFITCYKGDDYIKNIKNGTHVKHVISMKEELVNSRDFNMDSDSIVGNKDDIYLHELGRVANYKKRIINKHFGGKQDALILYTSGSTGKSKSLVFSNENLVSSCIYLKNSTHVPNVTDDDKRWMNVVPFMYPYGFGASVLQTFLSGREVILTPNLSPNNISYYYKKNPHLVFGSPAHLELTKRNLPKDQKLTGLKIYLSGGDYLSVSQSHEGIKFFKEHGADATISNSSGTGETLGCSTNAMNIPYRPETVGQLVIGPKYIILNPDTLEEVKYGEVGVLCTRGKHVFKGYYNDSELTEETMINYKGKKYYMTGNIGFLDRDRYFTLVGRASRFFIINTLNKVYCELVQSVVSNIDIVDSCAIVPKPNEESLYKSKAYVVLKSGIIPNKETEEYIIDSSSKTYIDKSTNDVINLKDYEIPESVTFLDELPRTEAGKIDYEKLKKMAEEEYNLQKKKILS